MAILAQWSVSIVRFMSLGCANLVPSHYDDCVSLIEPKTMSQLCGELYCVRFIGHVRVKSSMNGFFCMCQLGC